MDEFCEFLWNYVENVMKLCWLCEKQFDRKETELYSDIRETGNVTYNLKEASH